MAKTTLVQNETTPTQLNIIALSSAGYATAGTQDGDPILSDDINDYKGFASAVLNDNGITANGNPDTQGNSQVYQGLNKKFDQIRYKTLAEATSEDAAINTKYVITDLDNARYDVVLGADTGGYYQPAMASGRKLKLMDKVFSCKALGMVKGVGNDNYSKLTQLNNFDWDELIIDDYYEYNTSITLTKIRKRVKFSGLGTLAGVGAYLTLQGDLTDYGQISASSAKGGATVDVAIPSGLQQGEIVIIHNQNASSYSPHRAEYQDGEFNIVESVSGTTVTLQSPLKGDYTTLTNIKLYRLNPVVVNIENATFTSSGNALYALAIKNGAGFKAEAANVRCINNTLGVGALLIDKIYGGKIELSKFYNDAPNTGTQYGINISSCANFDIQTLPECYAVRHGIATGGDGTPGSVPCDSIWIKESKISNDQSSGVYAADFHGNTRNSGYIRCEIDGDVGVGGENITVDSCEITARRSNVPIELQEIVGGNIRITNNNVKLSPTFNFNTILAFSSSTLSQKVSKDFNLIVDGNNFEINSGVTEIITMLYNQDSAVDSTFSMNGFSIQGDDSGLTKYASLNRLGSGLNPSVVHISEDKYKMTGSKSYVTLSGSFAGTKMTLPSQRCPNVDLTILSGQSESSTGGTGNTGLYTFDYVNYPAIPHISANSNGWARAGNPQLFTLIDNASTNQCDIYTGTAADTITVTADRTLTINVSVSFDGVTL